MRPPAIAHIPPLEWNRRTFLKASVSAAGALLITIPLPPRSLSAATRTVGASPSWCVYLTLRPDNTAELVSPVMEMGQFMRTTGPMILADEMDLDWSLVTVTQDLPVRMMRNAKGELAMTMPRPAPAAVRPSVITGSTCAVPERPSVAC